MNVLAAARLIKAGFVYFDAPGTAPQVISFQYNPEALTRSLDAIPAIPGAVAAQPTPPREVMQFKLILDATDRLETGDPQATELGILPQLSALELLMHAPASSPNSLSVLVWGSRRILPVRITGLQITEQMFDTNLTPMRAEMAITLFVLNSVEMSSDIRAQQIWQRHLALLRQPAHLAYQSSMAPLGIAGLPEGSK